MDLAEAFIQTNFHCIQCLSYRSSNDNLDLTCSNYGEGTPMNHHDKWGGAESRKSGYRVTPVPLTGLKSHSGAPEG